MVRAWAGARPGESAAPSGHDSPVDSSDLLTSGARELAESDSDAVLADALIALGGRSVEYSGGGWTTYLPEDASQAEDPEEVAAWLRAETGLAEVEVELGWQDHADWEQLWKVGLEPRRVGDHFLVTPSWCDPEPREGDLVLVLDPGLAFGNAEHGTTRGCLRLLEHGVQAGDRVLDIGAGSGVLSIAAARLGAARCTAVEGDELAIATARENAERNGVGDCVDVVHAMVDAEAIAALGDAAGGFDGVICNIEGFLLEPLLPGLRAAARHGGWLLISGILDHQWDAFRDQVLATGAEVLGVDGDGEWRGGLFRVTGAPT